MTGSMIRDPSRVTPVTPARFLPPCRLITLVIAVTAAVGASCSSSSTSETGPTPVKCQVALNTPPALDANGGTGTLTITAQPECEWTVSTEASWLSDLSPTSGQGNGQVVFRAPANPQTSAREGEIVVNDARARVTQQASACRDQLNPASRDLSSDSASGNFEVVAQAGCSWTATSTATWISITGNATGSSNGTVSYSVQANAGAPRSGRITVGNEAFVINQGSGIVSCTYNLSSSSVSVPAGASSGSVNVTTDSSCAWTATSNAAWIGVTGGGSGSGSVSYSVQANTGAARSGTISIAGQTFTVNQAAVVVVPTLSISDAAVAEGNSGTTSLTFTVTLSAAPGAATVTVAYATEAGSASAQDFTATNGTLTFSGTTTTQTISVSVVGDTDVEPAETFRVVLASPSGATIADGSATGTITNDDMASLPTLSVSDAAAAEGNSGTTSLTFTVTLSAAPGAATVTVVYATEEGSARAPQDYTATKGTLTFSGTTTTQTISVSVVGDTDFEQAETFQVVLASPSGATIADGSATGTITNDDMASLPTLSVSDAAAVEGNSGTTSLTFTVTLSAAPGAATVTVAYATEGRLGKRAGFHGDERHPDVQRHDHDADHQRVGGRRHGRRASRNLPGRPGLSLGRDNCGRQRHGHDHQRRHGVAADAVGQRRRGGRGQQRNDLADVHRHVVGGAGRRDGDSRVRHRGRHGKGAAGLHRDEGHLDVQRHDHDANHQRVGGRRH